ncbi:hypothetical protein QAD02_018629 [Eretmocerus hayati]|uniref:Uncharacterized protein n=1 Tax=Eretmocerus hayati TaxID=131215 RepID=A0ACC2PHK6_9HYME|nr:hypothetical protein QAD02_018629 [Eretmocerus hayati]
MDEKPERKGANSPFDNSEYHTESALPENGARIRDGLKKREGAHLGSEPEDGSNWSPHSASCRVTGTQLPKKKKIQKTDDEEFESQSLLGPRRQRRKVKDFLAQFRRVSPRKVLYEITAQVGGNDPRLYSKMSPQRFKNPVNVSSGKDNVDSYLRAGVSMTEFEGTDMSLDHNQLREFGLPEKLRGSAWGGDEIAEYFFKNKVTREQKKATSGPQPRRQGMSLFDYECECRMDVSVLSDDTTGTIRFVPEEGQHIFSQSPHRPIWPARAVRVGKSDIIQVELYPILIPRQLVTISIDRVFPCIGNFESVRDFVLREVQNPNILYNWVHAMIEFMYDEKKKAREEHVTVLKNP